jgi:ribosome-associated translation inhibitor RaiA
LDTLIEDRILALEEDVQIDEARVRLECRWDESPGFRVAIHIVTPGPDLVVESSDHTLEAAIAKAVSQLEQKIRANAGNRLKRRRDRAQSLRRLRFGLRAA